MDKKIDKIYSNSRKYSIDDKSKIVIMSDCHRGAGDNFDNFLKNKNIYNYALKHYFINGFTYIELGDGDEMWEISNYADIINEHIDTFKIIKKFHDSNRLIMVYGNHDIYKKNNNVLKNLYKYYDAGKEKDLLNNLIVYESIILNYDGLEIFMLHGHQVDFLNGTIYFISRFLVRHIWKHFEHYLINDPTSAAKNYKVSKSVEKKLESWSNRNNKIIIAGHTHRPVFPDIGYSKYFNDGACVHPNGITCLEIEKGKIALVKWSLNLNSKKNIVPKRKILAGRNYIKDFYN